MVANFEGKLPTQLFKFFSYILNRGYRVADELIQSSPHLQKNDFGFWARPFLRLAIIHSLAQKSAQLVPGLRCEVQKTRKGGYSYLVLYINELAIVISHLAKVNGVQQVLPRKALFRTAMAHDNSQESFMPQLYPGKAKGLSDPKPIFAVLCHEGSAEPSIAKLIAPAPDGRGILAETMIDLSQTFTVDIEKVLDYEIEGIKQQHAEDGK